MKGAVVGDFGADFYNNKPTLVANSENETRQAQSDASSVVMANLVMEDKLSQLSTTANVPTLGPTGTLNAQHVTVITEPVVECHSQTFPSANNNLCEAQLAFCDQPDATEFKSAICTMGNFVRGEEKPACPESGTCELQQVTEQPEGLDAQPVNISPCESLSTTQSGLKMTNMDRQCYVTLERMNMARVNDGILNLSETPLTPTSSSSSRRVKFGTIVFGKMSAPPTPQRSILKNGNKTAVSDVEYLDDGSSDCVPELGSGSYNVSERRKNYDLRSRQMTGTSQNSFDHCHLQLRCSLRLLHKSNSPSYVAAEETPENALTEDVPDVTPRIASRKRKLFPSNDLLPESPKRLRNGSYHFCELSVEPAARFVNGTPADGEAEVTEMETAACVADQEVIAACYQHIEEATTNNGPRRKVRPPSLLGDCYVSLRQMDTSSFSDGTVVLSEEMVEKLSDKGCQASLQMPSQESPLEMDHGVCAKVEDEDTSVQTPLRCLTPSSAKIMKLMESVSRGIDAVEKLKGK